MNYLDKENDPNGQEAIAEFTNGGGDIFTFDCEMNNKKKLNIFYIMAERPTCATCENFKNAFEKWKENKCIDGNSRPYKKIRNINDFTKMVADIRFTRTEREKLIDFYQNTIKSQICDAVYLFPFICHIYVDYYIDLISPLKNLKMLAEKIKKDDFSTQENIHFIQNLFHYFAISYIWKVLNNAWKVTENDNFPFDDPKCKLEAEIFFQKDILKKEVDVKYCDKAMVFNIFASKKYKDPEKKANEKFYKILKDEIAQMIKFIFSDKDRNFLKYDDVVKHKEMDFYIMISRVCYCIILFIEKLNNEKEFQQNSQEVFPDSMCQNIFRIMCDIASTPCFIDDEKHFKTTSFILQILIEKGQILDKSLFDNNPQKIFSNSVPKVLLSYAVEGPPFFSSDKSRELKKKLVEKISNDEESEEDKLNLKNCYFYSCYPSLAKNDKESIKYKISKLIELSDSKQNLKNIDIKSLFESGFRNNVSFQNNQNNINNQNNQNNINIENIEFLIEVTPYFLFQEMSIQKENNNNSNSQLEEEEEEENNNLKFSEYLRNLISNDESNNICNKLSERYIFNSAEVDETKRKSGKKNDEASNGKNYQIFEVKSNDPNIKKLRDLFRWQILQFLIEIDTKNSKIELHIDDTKCKKLFVKYFILSKEIPKRDSELISLIKYTNSDKLLKGIEDKVKEYCKRYKLMHSYIALINPKDNDEKLKILIEYLTEILEEIKEEGKTKKENAIEILDLAVKQIKYKTDETGKKNTVVNQMCKKIFDVFCNLFTDVKNTKIIDGKNTVQIDDFILQLFISFAYESIDIIQTKSALKRIKKFIEKLAPNQMKAVIISLFNFFEVKRSQRDHILKILSNDQNSLAKQNSIESNSGHLYEFQQSVCFNCKEKVASYQNIGFVQFFTCGHIFHIYNCTGIRKNNFYKKCPVCPNNNNKNIIMKSRRKSNIDAHRNPYFEYFFDLRDDRFHNSVDPLPSLYETMMFPTCISDPPISVKVNYDNVDSFFNSNDDLIINFNENDP